MMNESTESYTFCKNIATKHYENFPVASILIPKDIRKHIFTVYTFARVADDIADEGNKSDENKKKELINYKNNFTANISDYQPHFPAVFDTIDKFSIPKYLFTDLIDAFIQDTEKKQYNNFNELLNYCQKSANPVGRILLHIFGETGEETLNYSDKICTALQLTNFYQDISLDLQKNRCYLPVDEIQNFNLSLDNISRLEYSKEFVNLMRFQINRTRKMFLEGKNILASLNGRFKLEIKLTINGGSEILSKIEKLNYNTLHIRPKLNKIDIIKLLIKSTIL